MEDLVHWLLKRYRPRIGWPLWLCAALLVCCAGFGASTARFALPSATMIAAGLLGLLPGLWLGSRTTARAGLLGLAVLALGGGVLLALFVGAALPPFGLILRDIMAVAGWLEQMLRQRVQTEPVVVQSAGFLGQAVPRFGREVGAALDAGEQGARLIVALVGTLLAWIGALLLGEALGRGRKVLPWLLPLLAGLGFVTIFGGASIGPLAVGVGLAWLLVLGVAFRWREGEWDRRGLDFSDELRQDVAVWGGVVVIVTVLVALVLPTSFDSLVAALVWRDVDAPSALQALDAGAQRPRPQPTAPVPVRLRWLSGVELGVSLQQGEADTPALQITPSGTLPADWPLYWRAQVLNNYTGRRWDVSATIGERSPTTLDPATVPDGFVLQTVRDLRPGGGLLAALPDVVAVNQPVQELRLGDGTLVAQTAAISANIYLVLSRPQWLATAPGPDTAAPDLRPYLGLPGDLPPRVGELARALVGSETNPRAQAQAIERYLRRLPYSYEVRPLPRNGDAVDQFLFEMRQGYCTYYASSMAVLARSLGIPARVAVGYATGTLDVATGSYTVREQDAHAWPELYLGGQWVPFEPTPVRPLPGRSAVPTPVPAPVVVPEPRGQWGWLGWLALLGLLGTLSAWLWLRGRRKVVRQPAVVMALRRLEQGGRRAGVPWPRGATLYEYGRLVLPAVGGATDALGRLVALATAGRYGRRPLDAGEQEELMRAADQVDQSLAAGRGHSRR